jgi:hypothetical protein
MEHNGMVITEDYRTVMTAIVRKMVIVMGKEKALRLAGRVPGVMVSPDGGVTSDADLERLRQLVREYRAAGGTVALYLMKGAVASAMNGSKLPLPEELR